MEISIKEARIKIARLVAQPNGRYSHIGVTTILRSVAKEHGYSKANHLIDEFELTRIFEIKKVRKTGKSE
tara:strand:- start:941 stop:1150 length:210 start_codon:yes stop_codon:yes gene_type:complete